MFTCEIFWKRTTCSSPPVSTQTVFHKRQNVAFPASNLKRNVSTSMIYS